MVGLYVTANNTSIRNNSSSTITVNLLHDSNGTIYDPADGCVPDGTPVIFTSSLGSISSPVSTINGRASSTFNSGNALGIAMVSATLDNQTMTTPLTIYNSHPSLVSIDPANNSASVPDNKVIKVTFNESIKDGSMWIDLYDSTGKIISITTSIDGNVLTINHFKVFANGKCKLSLHTGSITDLNGDYIPLCGSISLLTAYRRN
jgi:hypothetical protein